MPADFLPPGSPYEQVCLYPPWWELQEQVAKLFHKGEQLRVEWGHFPAELIDGVRRNGCDDLLVRLERCQKWILLRGITKVFYYRLKEQVPPVLAEPVPSGKRRRLLILQTHPE